jgi:uncharacterized protein YjbI with pentapeptide repeats
VEFATTVIPYNSRVAVREETTMRRLALTMLVVAMMGTVCPALAAKPEDVEECKKTKQCQKKDLKGAYLRNLDLDNADMTEADLTLADLSNTSLLNAKFNKAKLTGANLTGANLTGVELTDADLTNVILDGAFISESAILGDKDKDEDKEDKQK